MIEIIPAILSRDYEDLKNKISLVKGLVPIVQIDFCDGIFLKNKTWPFWEGGFSDFNFNKIMYEEEGLPFWEDIDFELDLMVSGAIENFDIYTKLGPKRIIFHLEAMEDINSFKNFLEGIDFYIRDLIQIGIAIENKTEIEKLFPLINHVDFIQCMGIEHIGFQKQKFDEGVIEKIKSLREKFPDLVISVDGGVNLNTAKILIEAGANRLIVGSAIFDSEDIIETIEEFKRL